MLLSSKHKQHSKAKGFTLIELLIVIAIIGVLAATVVVSLGSQTENAQIASAKSGVSTLRTAATVAAVEGGYGANGVCDEVYEQVSGEKSTWTWSKNPYRICTADSASDDGEICCSSTGDKWVFWAKLGGNGADSGEVYCTDNSGYLGKFLLLRGGSEKVTNPSVEAGKGNSTTIIRCKQ